MADVRRHCWTAAQYFADPALSRSDLDIYIDSPRLYFKRRVERSMPDPTPTAALRIGTMLHHAVLEPDMLAEPFFTGDARVQKERRQVEDMLAALESSRTDGARAARVLLWGDGLSEVSLTWTDDATGLARRARLDRIIVRSNSVLVVDLKSTDDPSPSAFAKSIAKFGYHRQAAYYCDAAREYAGDNCAIHFAFVAIRKEPPHEIAVYQLDDEAIALGKEEIDEAMLDLARSLKTNDWSAPWEREPTTIHLPGWARKRGVR